MNKKSKTILGLGLLNFATTISNDQYAQAVKQRQKK